LHDAARGQTFEGLGIGRLLHGDQSSYRPAAPIPDHDRFATGNGAEVGTEVGAKLAHAHGSLGSLHVVTVTVV
jgi:hypothetical protein